MYLRALAGKEKALGTEHTWMLNMVHNLAIVYSTQGKIDEAKDMYLQALAGKEKSWGAEHESTRRTVENLIILYKNQGKMKEAEEMYVRASAGKERTRIPSASSLYTQDLI